ncbi:ABC transporter, ATP-binding protein [Necator americanus]|uniref:ABC transporter, ATP-binding protein n=1 Tax=Necator americanus TaxID=51031 RepID=W2TH57_NECAM|nr:ABC transporter, ATP-binding protein [Necator americanus]ETN80929.1 ABC transporter, ATP-binding protein [Necator americanus]
MTLAMLGKVNAVSISKAMKSLTVAATICEESVMNVRTVQSCNGQEQMTKRYSEALRHALSHSVRGHFWMGFFEGLSSFQIYVIVGLALWFGCYGFYHGLVAHRGDVLLCVNTISLTAYYLGMLGPHMMALLKARVSAAIIYHTIDQTTANDSKSRDLEKEIVAGHVVFDNVHFTYPTRDKAVLDGLSWEARAGEKIALVGPSGCGKSTSIALLTQLYQANNGRITIDGVDLHEMDVSALRKRIGIVQQEPQLFNGTIKENISLNREDVDDARIKRASETANATKFIEKLQNGFDTFIGPGGVTLSGGQKQRIAIARAIVTDPCILFLDEATSALDASNEKIVQTALEQAAKGRTTITIAHRLGAIKNVGKIFVIEQGKVVEAGEKRSRISRPLFLRLILKDLILNCWLGTNSKISSGLLMTYRSLEGSYLLALCSLIVAFVRALELPGLGLAYLCAFKALQMSEDTYWVYAIYAFLVSLGCGLLIWLSQCLSLAVEIVERARTIQLAAIEKGYLEKYHQQRLKSVLYDRRIGLVDSINFAITQSFVFFCDLSCYVLGTYLIYNGLAFLGAQFSGWSIMYSAPYFPDLIKADGSARVLFEMVGEQSAKSYESGAQPAISGNVKLADVKFFYPARPDLNVINGLSLAAEHGESIALVGPSGCGKSTVCIDDKKIDDINMCYLRSRVTLVGQEPVLFKGSILDNVMLGVDGCSREDAVAACHMANANKFIELLPEAYDTDVGEEGHLLSGGQKQRIAIARALVRKPQILLLDEATSALDTQNEQIVQQALNDAKVDRTTIIIAHRLNSVQHCDRIFYIENGKVVESGTHTSLLQVNGKYARLVRTQNMS